MNEGRRSGLADSINSILDAEPEDTTLTSQVTNQSLSANSYTQPYTIQGDQLYVVEDTALTFAMPQ